MPLRKLYTTELAVGRIITHPMIYYTIDTGEENSHQVVFRGDKCYILSHFEASSRKNRNLVIEEVRAAADSIADVLSWKLNTTIDIVQIMPSNPKKIPAAPASTPALLCENLLDGTARDQERLDILAAMRKAKGIYDPTLRFLIYYRFIEAIAAKHGRKFDAFLRDQAISVPWIPERRNPKKKQSLLTHLRNKIHPTNQSFNFPYRALAIHANWIEYLTRRIVQALFFPS